VEPPSLRLESVVFHFIVDAHGFRLSLNAGLNRQVAKNQRKAPGGFGGLAVNLSSLVTRDVPAYGVFA
jgi:hypothetical protein